MEDEVGMKPEELSPVLPKPEQLTEQKQISFEDQRGIERKPHSAAAECYASEEIQTVVYEHFLGVDQEIDEVTQDLENLVNPEQPAPEFDPLTDDLLGRVKATATEQLPKLSKTIKITKQTKVKAGVFRRTKIVEEDFDEVVPVPGSVLGSDSPSFRSKWHSTKYHVESRAAGITNPEDVIATETKVESLIEDLLVGEGVSRDGVASDIRELPLLATKIRDANLSKEQIESLTWEDIIGLVPEATPWFEDITLLQEQISAKTRLTKFNELLKRMNTISPEMCTTIARIYYSDDKITEISQLYIKVKAQLDKAQQEIHPDEPIEELTEDQFTARQIDAIGSYFDKQYSADTILVHGTRFIPRIIKSGSLKPAAGMDEIEFTFNTNRSSNPNAGTAGTLKGSSAVHWAGSEGSRDYSLNSAVDETRMREELAGRLGVSADHAWVDRELQKGEMANSKLLIRMGDLIKHTPYQGKIIHDNISDDPKTRMGMVELTQAGWDKVHHGLIDQDTQDAVFLAAPQHHEDAEVFDYAYPLDDLMIGIPEADPETVPRLLREKGWTEDMILYHTFTYRSGPDENKQLQVMVKQRPKYPRSVIVPFSKDL